MAHSPLGRTLVIANPTSHSGKGAAASDFVDSFLSSYRSATRGYRMLRTEAKGDAELMARESTGYDTVLAIGGDGVIHEVATGLMALPRSERPQLGIVPVGTGNDYARTLGIARNDPAAAMAQLVRGTTRETEVGLVNGTPFVETLSFGLDAAIALDTTTKRDRGTSQRGEALFVTSGIRILSKAREGYHSMASFDDAEPIPIDDVVFAIQVGPTYGGGFSICPRARIDDGVLDVCYNVRIPSIPHVLALFGLARGGRHVGSDVLSFRQIRHAEIDFEREPPCQADGERVTGTHFEVDVVPSALRVVLPSHEA